MVMGGARTWAAVPMAFSRNSPPGVKGTGSDSEVYLAHSMLMVRLRIENSRL